MQAQGQLGNRLGAMQHQRGQIAAMHGVALSRLWQVAPGRQLQRCFGRDAQAGRSDQHQPGDTGAKFCRQQAGNHTAKRKAHQVASAVAEQALKPLRQRLGHYIGIGALKGRS